MMERRWFSAKEAGEIFGVCPKTLLSLAGRKRLPAGAVLKIGRQVRFDVAAIEAGAAERKAKH